MNTFVMPEMPAELKGSSAKKKWVAEWGLRKLAHELGWTVVGEYTGNHKPIHMICPEGHDCYPTPNGFKNGNRCRVCSGICPIQAEKDFRELAASEGWTIVGEYTGNNKPIHMICPEGHDCYPTPASFKNGTRCRVCAGRCPIQAEKDFRELAALEGWTIVGEYTGDKKKIHMICPEGHDCYPTPKSFKSGRRCRVCAEYGFNPDRCGYVYLYRWTNNNHTFLKYGITHHIDQRHKDQSRNTEYTPDLLYARFFLMNGQACIDKEKEIKTAVGTRYITKDILPDGYTETCPDTQENIDTIISIINQ